MFDKDNIVLTLESSGKKYTAELKWDADIDTLIETFYGLCITSTYHPLTVLKHMKSFSEESLDSFKNKNDIDYD